MSVRVLVAYDVANDRRRAKVAKILLGYGRRVQESVFETGDLAAREYLRMRSLVEGALDREVDDVRYVRLCRACARRVEHIGPGPEAAVDEGEPCEIVAE